MQLAIFDFDGTITTKDSFKDFIIFTHGLGQTALGALILSPILILFALKLLSNSLTKEFVVTYFYRGWDQARLKGFCRRYAANALPRIVKRSALDKIHWHQAQGHKIVVVSASPEFYLEDWCQAMRIELLATRIEYKNDHVTGKLEGLNCHGEEKVRRIKEKYRLSDFDHVYAYGDTAGDRPLAKIASEFHYRTFN